MHVVYHSFLSRFSDNPRDVYERLRDRPGLTHTWLDDPGHAAAFHDGIRTVAVGCPHDEDARAVLESADLLVANTHMEVEWDKPAGTTYLQTWHGTPLKRIHHDVLFAPEGRLDLLDQDVARWDVLLSPNAVSTPRLRQAFRYDGPVWETGYPRNDLLVGPDAAGARASVRAELGLAEDETVVLYAQTWRDDEKFREDDATLEMNLHLGDPVQRLDAGGSRRRRHRVLARLHSMISERIRPEVAPGVLDVSSYRDVRELYLAVDALVHPHPGRWAASYDAFRQTYGGLEDGHATDRVLERLGLLQP
jgi:CDP-glycerol glycerophosphotransferase